MNTRIIRALLALAALLPVAPSAFAAESFDNCTGFIDTLPTTISTQGTWCLRQDLSTNMSSGNAITINTANVTIDCNGYKVGGLAAGDGTNAVGIHAMDRSNTTVRNCNIRGFVSGATIYGSAALIEDNRFEGNTSVGVAVVGAGSMVRRNTVVSTGGSLVNPSSYGIVVQEDVDVIDNTVDTVLARSGGAGTGQGLRIQYSTGASILGNRIRNVFGDGAGEAFGIIGLTVSRVTIADNQVIGAGSGTGISCEMSDSPATGNTIAGFETALTGCDNIAGTNMVAN
jgi:hypothetical protein